MRGNEINMSVEIIQGDALEVLRGMDAESVHCCVTSPPYWGLRDYGVPGQLGLEDSPDEYVEKMVAIFSEVRRVLRGYGTLWLNLGDSYAAHPGQRKPSDAAGSPKQISNAGSVRCGSRSSAGLKPKDLVGIPWMAAFALRADGWYLRQDIIWHKPNPMPESVTDRCTKAHEYIFLMSKSERYYFNSEAIAEASSGVSGGACFGKVNHDGPGSRRISDEDNARIRGTRKSGNKERKPGTPRELAVDTNGHTNGAVAGSVPWEGSTRNKRSVWTVTTKPYKAAHFATFPPDLIKPCILAGCPEGGTVLDPFLGSGTTAMVAQKNGCNCIGIELNPEYVKLAKRRIQQRSLLTRGSDG